MKRNHRNIGYVWIIDGLTKSFSKWLSSWQGLDTFPHWIVVKGYYQVPLTVEASDKTAFVSPFGHYQFVRMPFGLNGASKTFQRLMDKVLYGLTYAWAKYQSCQQLGRNILSI